ncbi:TolC family protein [bacterium]|nr:TolC family protein [bacterium]
MRRVVGVACIAACAASLAARTGGDILDRYVEEGLRHNPALAQKRFAGEKSAAALHEAAGLFLPTVSVEARYTAAGGGRVIDLPIGDLMNPVYQALHVPITLPNQTIPFLREREQETKVHVVQPVLQPAIMYNYKIRSALRDVERLSVSVFSRGLVSDIRTAYYNYLKADAVCSLLTVTGGLVTEHARVAESLFRHDKVTRADVLRASADLAELRRAAAEAEKNRSLSVSYFNCLLNRPLDAPIEKPAGPMPLPVLTPEPAEAESLAVANREELKQLERAVDLMRHKVSLNRTSFLPGVAAVFDWGYWDEMYRFDNEHDFWTASLAASWNLFNGFQDKHRVDQAKLERMEKRCELEDARNRIRLQARDAATAVAVGRRTLEAAAQKRLAGRKAFELVERRYREGMAPQIEVLAARTAWTQAEIEAAVAEYDLHIRAAELEKVTAVGEWRLTE